MCLPAVIGTGSGPEEKYFVQGATAMHCKSCGAALHVDEGARSIVELGRLARQAGLPDPDYWAVQVGPLCGNCVPGSAGADPNDDAS